MTVMISHDLRPSPAMPSYYVAWSRGKYQILHVLTRLTGLEELTLRDMSLGLKILKKNLAKRVRPPNPCRVNFSMLVHLCMLRLMK